MRGGPRLPLIFSILTFVLVVSAWVSAYAQTATVVTNIGATQATPGMGSRMIMGKDDKGMEIYSPVINTPFFSLTDYFEKVWWPRRIALDQVVVGNQQMYDAVKSEMAVRTAEAQQANANGQVIKQMVTQDAKKAIGRTEVLCAKPSRWQSANAMREMVTQERFENMQAYSKEANGDSSQPAFSKGFREYAAQVVESRNASGVCSKTGADGTDETWCKNPKPKLENIDQNPQVLLTAKSLQSTDKEDPSHEDYANMYIRNMFPKRSFQPLSGNVDKSAGAEVLTNRSAYVARVNTFMVPFNDAKTEHTGKPNLDALEPLKEQMKDAGYSPELINLYFPQGQKVSKSAMDYVNYVVYYTDPKTTIKYLSDANDGNTMAVVAQTLMDLVPLMYDIREEARKSNMLLGALGGVELEKEFDVINAQTTGLASSPGS